MKKPANPESIFFCGIGGSGMSALAQIYKMKNFDVCGSDRSHDNNEGADKFSYLQRLGIKLFPQDGSGITSDIKTLVVSTAIEDRIPDIKVAKELGISIQHRSEILASLFHESNCSIGIAGTSGKSTITAMTGWILSYCNQKPTIVNGADMKNFMQKEGALANVLVGSDDYFVAEIDESDASIERFSPTISVIANITLDHKPLEELRSLFGRYIQRTKKYVLYNEDDLESHQLAKNIKDEKMTGFGIDTDQVRFQATHIHIDELTSRFKIVDHNKGLTTDVHLNVPGKHNIYNALAAIGAAVLTGISLSEAAEAISFYEGIARRFDILGAKNGITVIDDFAHNPDKIAATLRTLSVRREGKVWAIFQPHGFAPTKLMKDELARVFADNIGENEVLLMPEIYYAGGTADKSISSNDIVKAVKESGREAYYFEQRKQIIPFLTEHIRAKDYVVVMGARDITLPAFAHDILESIRKELNQVA